MLPWATAATALWVAATNAAPPQSELAGATASSLDVRRCFNATDSTSCLQRGLDAAATSGQLLRVPAMPSPWVVTPLFLRRNGTHVRLGSGVIIEARRAAPGRSDFFAGYTDCLVRIMRFEGDAAPPMNSWDKHKRYPTLPLFNISLTADGSATLRMWKQDYMDRSRYNFTEHRHAISMSDVTQVQISNLVLANSGGDGIDISDRSQNITIHRVVASDNYRQGMSIISAQNLLVQDSVFQRTRGTPPESGIDLE
jgi:hypothetical protein